jgi:hypothetical protein
MTRRMDIHNGRACDGERLHLRVLGEEYVLVDAEGAVIASGTNADRLSLYGLDRGAKEVRFDREATERQGAR